MTYVNCLFNRAEKCLRVISTIVVNNLNLSIVTELFLVPIITLTFDGLKCSCDLFANYCLLPCSLCELQKNNIQAQSVWMWGVSRAAVMSSLSDDHSSDALDPVTAHQSTSYATTCPHVNTHTCTRTHMYGQRTQSDTPLCVRLETQEHNAAEIYQIPQRPITFSMFLSA